MRSLTKWAFHIFSNKRDSSWSPSIPSIKNSGVIFKSVRCQYCILGFTGQFYWKKLPLNTLTRIFLLFQCQIKNFWGPKKIKRFLFLNLRSNIIALRSNQNNKNIPHASFCLVAFVCCFRFSSKDKWSKLYLGNFFLYFILIGSDELIWTLSLNNKIFLFETLMDLVTLHLCYIIHVKSMPNSKFWGRIQNKIKWFLNLRSNFLVWRSNQKSNKLAWFVLLRCLKFTTARIIETFF